MKRFYLKSFLFISPFAIAYFMELFVLPIDFFTFRCWEALKVNHYSNRLAGPFYPCYKLEREEVGDLGSNTIFSDKKKVVWITDSYGFRFDEKDRADKYDIVIQGDSFIVGTGLDQKEMLHSQLGKLINKTVYPYAPSSLNEYLEDMRFVRNPPKILIYAVSEGRIRGDDKFEPHDIFKTRDNRPPKSSIGRWAYVICDRFMKQCMIRFVQIRVQETFFQFYRRIVRGEKTYVRNSAIVSTDETMLFLRYELDIPEFNDKKLIETCNNLLKYQQILKKRGTSLVFCPIPYKTTIYHKLVPIKYPDGLERLIKMSNEIGIPTVDLVSSFINEKLKQLIYQKDDTHWNNIGVSIAANKIMGILNSKK